MAPFFELELGASSLSLFVPYGTLLTATYILRTPDQIEFPNGLDSVPFFPFFACRSITSPSLRLPGFLGGLHLSSFSLV
jgi:hypothetical protein